jgi:Rho-binding antiterminator
VTDAYQPIDCGVHDRLEDLVVRRVVCRIRYTVYSDSGEDATGGKAEVEGRIADVFARGGEEFVRVDDGREIRLDRLLVVAPTAGK